MSSYGLSLVLAVVACVIGGVLGGLALARPGSAPGLAGGDAPPSAPDAGALAQGRAFGGLLILSHATAALFLGYQSSVGAAMAFALAMAWLGAALGRTASLLIDKAGGRLNLSNLAFEVLIAATLSLPFFNAGRLVVRGSGMLV
ncbi:hypothetical protein PMI01_01416 [Caulobacter sp. AP07]|uniref:DUF4345 family protein n=1 Tax=Caulobacter sp. AP07 TaxID=1144304 RepID=UPI000272069F|nr:DUF4345 family protein [Caulobacter sp. AP07]EJL34723.1 hypothetical protein PMI01_01416 [Caulobacter sp. AP07]